MKFGSITARLESLEPLEKPCPWCATVHFVHSMSMTDEELFRYLNRKKCHQFDDWREEELEAELSRLRHIGRRHYGPSGRVR